MCEYAVVDPLTFTNSLADLIGYCVSLFPLFFLNFLFSKLQFMLIKMYIL